MSTPNDMLARVARAKELDRASSKGPWWVHDSPNGGDFKAVADAVPDVDDQGMAWPVFVTDYTEERDAALIAEYRTLCPQFAADVESLLAENAKLRTALTKVAEREWIIASWYDEQTKNFNWRVNVMDGEPRNGSQYYEGTRHVGATPSDAALAALAATQEKSA